MNGPIWAETCSGIENWCEDEERDDIDPEEDDDGKGPGVWLDTEYYIQLKITVIPWIPEC